MGTFQPARLRPPLGRNNVVPIAQGVRFHRRRHLALCDQCRFIVRQHYGYYDPETHDWDFATGFNSIFPREAESLWPTPAALGKSDDILHAWGGMPQRHQMHFRLVGEIPYGEIIEIDQEPDDFSDYPVVFTSFRRCKGGGFEPPFLDRVSVQLEPSLTYSQAKWIEERHVRVVPREMRDLEWEEAWSSANGWKLSTRSVELPLDQKIADMRREMQNELRGRGGRQRERHPTEPQTRT